MSQDANVTLRALRSADRPAWAELWQAYLAFYDSALPGSVYDSTFARLTDPSDTGMNAIVAEQGGRLVGLVHYLYHAHCWKPEGVCYLQDLYVDPSLRGTGLGRALIEAVYAAADKDGHPTVYWLTQTFNTTARQLYDRVAVQTPFIKYQRA